MAKKTEENINLEPIKKTLLKVELIGTSDLILNKKARSYELSEVWKQTHPKGTKMPKRYEQAYNLWEHLITSVTWDKPIQFFDEDYSKYTEEMWRDLMENNAPCILSNAFIGGMAEAFKTFGFKEGTGKAGTDLKRSIIFTKPKNPIKFATVGYEQKLVPNNGINKTNVVAQYNVFSGWTCIIEIACADIVFPETTIIDLLATTGEFIGVGTQRKNGFGHWKIGNIEKSEF